MVPRKKKTLFNVIRVAICVAALWFVIQGVTLHDHVSLADGRGDLIGTAIVRGDSVEVIDTDGKSHSLALSEVAVDEHGDPMISFGLSSAWRDSNKLLLLLAVLLHFPVIFPQALRFRWLLSAQGIHLGYRECLRLSFAGNFLNFAAPFGSHGGDVFKAYFVSLHTDHKTEAVTTVVLDRIIGLSSLVLVVAMITTFSPGTSRLSEFRPYMLGVIGVLAAGSIVYLTPWFRRYLVPWKLLEKLPMYDQLQRIDRTTRKLAGHVGVVIAAVLLTIALQALAMCAYLCVAIALGLAIHAYQALECFAYFYTGVVIQALPGPPQGLGTVELAYRYFFSPFGTPSQIVCMALLIRIVALVCATPGLLVTMTGSYKPSELEKFEASLESSDVASTSPDAAVLHRGDRSDVLPAQPGGAVDTVATL